MGRPKDECQWVATTKQKFLQPLGGWSIKTTDGFTIDGASAAGAQTEIGSSDHYGFDMDTDGETATLLWLIPKDLDVSSDIVFNVAWSPIDGITTQTVTWKVLYTVTSFESTVALAAPATALTTAITADAENDTPHVPQKSPDGTLDGGTITQTQQDAPAFMGFYIETDAISAGNGGHILGLFVTYTTRQIAGA